MTGIKELAEGLSPLERGVVPHLKDGISLDELISKSGLSLIEVMRAIQWLENKGALKINTETKEVIMIDDNGRSSIENGLPEKRFLKALEKAMTLDEISKKADLEKTELNVSIGMLKGKAAIDMKYGKISITDQGKKLLSQDSLEEKFLKRLSKGNIVLSDLSPEEKFAFDNLKKRKNIVKTSIQKTRTITLTDIGKKLLKEKVDDSTIERLTPEMIKDGSWKGKKFRRYDVKINVPKIDGGKIHFVNQAIDYAKRIWMDMGFSEMTGTYINTSFWNFDALFTAQDHPVRELQDTFYIKDPKKGRLPNKELIKAVSSAHENGGDTDSTGWMYKWDPEDAKLNVLRTHTTVLSAQTIAGLKKEDLPAKFFAVGRCFRNETLDWSHLFEFNQTEGIVIDPDANFRHLLGYLKNFFKKMGFPKARFRPAHFPYTEPSVEIDVFHPVHQKWVELGGAGIFRPEVVKPILGIDVPVLAWGPGFDRIILEYYKITDIRDLYKNDLKQTRSFRAWMK